MKPSTSCLLFISLAAAGCSQPAKNKPLPNIVFILADDLGYGDLSCYGSTSLSTPNIDGIAAHGLWFANAHSTLAISTPSPYSLLTGEYAWRRKETGVMTGKSKSDRDWVVEHSSNGRLSLIKGYWKYIEPGPGVKINANTNTETVNDPLPRLYNLKTDLGEKNNVAVENPAIVKELTDLLQIIKENK
jgi:arylsulfatase A-like enzyme